VIAVPDPHVVFAGGGTAGHLFPGLAVAQRLLADVPRARITFAGCGLEFEQRHVAAAGFDYLRLPCRPMPRRLCDLFAFFADNLRGYRQARRFLARNPAAAVVGLGGYVSVPMARAAVGRKVPLVLLEQNAAPGRATRWLAPRAALVCTAFEQAGRRLSPRCPVRVTGNPIGAGFNVVGPDGRDPATLADRSLLILGGSRGARSLNRSMPLALAKIRSALAGWKVIHQTGTADFQATRRAYRELRLEAAATPFLTDVPDALAQAGLAVCRAGGTTLAELAAAGVPAVLVPYPHASDDHQRKNADVFTSCGASLTVDDREVAGRLQDVLAETVGGLVGDPAKRADMSEAIRRLSRPLAAEDVAGVIRQLAGDDRVAQPSVAGVA
jgi:UDP-N-acetylglucosamine--N-acetylmuramyl-(pentapeptide) pyrophosphoryl-undecaprenol N-acetylglucosamine transferase